jgi:hypothetical protein
MKTCPGFCGIYNQERKIKVLGIGIKMLNSDLIFNYLIPRKIAELSKKTGVF